MPVGSLEWAVMSPSKMGALQPQSTPTSLSWLASTPLHWTLLRQGEERGRQQHRKKLWFQPFDVYPGKQKPCRNDHQWMKSDKRFVGNFTKERSRWPYLQPSGPTWWNSPPLRADNQTRVSWCGALGKTQHQLSGILAPKVNLNWINPVSLTSSL